MLVVSFDVAVDATTVVDFVVGAAVVMMRIMMMMIMRVMMSDR